MMPEDKDKPQETQILVDKAKDALARISLLVNDLALQTVRLKKEVNQVKTEVTETLASKKA